MIEIGMHGVAVVSSRLSPRLGNSTCLYIEAREKEGGLPFMIKLFLNDHALASRIAAAITEAASGASS